MYQNLVFTVTVTLKGKKKKNQLHHLDPKFGNQMEHYPCSLFLYLEFWEPPNHNILNGWMLDWLWSKGRVWLSASEGPRAERVWKETKPASLWGMYDTHTQDWSNKSFWSLRPGRLLLHPHYPHASPRPSTGTDNAEFSLNPESLRHISYLPGSLMQPCQRSLT